MKYDNQLRYAVKIINDYDGRVPLSVWLKDFFKANKQMGSRDRKTVAEMVYGFYRLGHNKFSGTEERVLRGISLSGNIPEVKKHFFPSSVATEDHSMAGVNTIPGSEEISKIFPWQNLLSEGIDKVAFASSFMVQPDLFLRVRPGKKAIVQDKLDESGIHYNTLDDACIALPNSTKVESLLEINKEVVIQDRSSQKTGSFIKPAIDMLQNHQAAPAVWDCCAASGGKAIMAFDLIKNIDLTVSDIRPSIIDNLRTRFSEAGISGYKSFVADIGGKSEIPRPGKYDLIIADVPCTGSGTWSRTPEQLYFFKEEKIDQYRNLQKNILKGVIPSLKPGGALLYITCSVFAKENEEIVKYAMDTYHLHLVKMELIAGYKNKADTLFAALLKG